MQGKCPQRFIIRTNLGKDGLHHLSQFVEDGVFNTTIEEDIMTNIREGEQFQSLALQKKAIKPIGESKSDFEVVCEIARCRASMRR